ncbi:MAG: hypothetical protein HOQ04_03350, partial [Pseudarthrobacter sp.]|nr:hypothetical protein [Pseudarthrobacter sp.]
MTVAPARQQGAGQETPHPARGSGGSRRVGAYPWAMAGSIAVGVCGAALSL